MWQCFLNVEKKFENYLATEYYVIGKAQLLPPSIHLIDGVIQSHCTSFFLH